MNRKSVIAAKALEPRSRTRCRNDPGGPVVMLAMVIFVGMSCVQNGRRLIEELVEEMLSGRLTVEEWLVRLG